MDYKFSEDILDVINQKTEKLFEKLNKTIPENFKDKFKEFHYESRTNNNLVRYIIHKKLNKIDKIILLDELKDSENNEELLNIIWDYIHSIYLLHEYALLEPNKEILSAFIKKININETNNSVISNDNHDNDNEDDNEDEDILNNIKEAKEFKMFSDIFETIAKNMNIDTSGTNTSFVNDIMDDIKININNSEGVDDLFNSTKNIGEKYKNMFDEGKITMNDIMSGMMGLISNPKKISKSMKDINVNKLPDMNTIMNKLANEVGNNDEIKQMMKSDMFKNMNLDPSNPDFNPLDIINNMMSGISENKNETDTPLTNDQIAEMESFYSNLNIGKE
jgi:hypothetical protein